MGRDPTPPAYARRALSREPSQGRPARRARGRRLPGRLIGIPLAALLAAYAAVSGSYAGGPDLRAAFDTWVYCGLLLAATGLIGARALAGGRVRPAWLTLAAAPALWVGGELVWEFALADHADPP